MPSTQHYDLDIDTSLGGNNASDYIIPSQKAIKDYVDNHSGSSGANTDLSNITNSGDIVIAHNSMPSATYINLTAGASGTTYTAPADGWFEFGSSLAMVIIDVATNLSYMTQAASGIGGGRGCLPVAKGATVQIFYTGSVSRFFFIYAIGSESEA